MGIVELVDQTAAEAISQATELEEHLRDADDTGVLSVDEYRAELHRLIGSIVSMRNAAELLKREASHADPRTS